MHFYRCCQSEKYVTPEVASAWRFYTKHDGVLFNLAHLMTKLKIYIVTMREIRFADSAALKLNSTLRKLGKYLGYLFTYTQGVQADHPPLEYHRVRTFSHHHLIAETMKCLKARNTSLT